MTTGTQFRPPPPPALNSPEYTAAYNELIEFGGDGITTATERRPRSNRIGIYWGYDGQPGLCSPPRLMYNQIAVQIAGNSRATPMANARFLCLVNLAMADAGILRGMPSTFTISGDRSRRSAPASPTAILTRRAIRCGRRSGPRATTARPAISRRHFLRTPPATRPSATRCSA